MTPVPIGADEGPEVWDELFGKTDQQRWVRVWFKTGKAVEGILIGAGVSPSVKQLHLAGTLSLLDENGAVCGALSQAGVESIWIDVTTEVLRIDIYGN